MRILTSKPYITSRVTFIKVPILTIDVGTYFGAKLRFDVKEALKKSAMHYSAEVSIR